MKELREPFSSLRRLKGNEGLLPVYAGVIAEARRSMDDWVPVETLAAFEEVARGLGLVVVRDCIFDPLPTTRVDALDRSPTTRNLGLPLRELSAASPQATVHVFVSKRREWAEEALCCFSYPVGIPRERLLIRPRVDAARVGAAFGYPACCVDSFMKWNDWRNFSHFSEAYRGSRIADRRVNCLPRNTGLMTIFHAPCSPQCRSTIVQSQAILEAVGELDADYACNIEEYLSGVFLIVNEAAVFKLHEADFDGPNIVAFQRAERIVPLRSHRPPHFAALFRMIEEARWVEVADGMITTRGDRELTYELDPRADWLEDPMLITFE